MLAYNLMNWLDGSWTQGSKRDGPYYTLEAFLDTSKAYQDRTPADTSFDRMVEVSG
jgi:hypothetical protein